MARETTILYTQDVALYYFCRLLVESVYAGVLNSDSFFISPKLKNRFGTISRGKAEKSSKSSLILLVDVYIYLIYQLIFRFLNGKNIAANYMSFQSTFFTHASYKGNIPNIVRERRDPFFFFNFRSSSDYQSRN